MYWYVSFRRGWRGQRTSGAAGTQFLGTRSQQKEATRNRVLEAARLLFETVGYQATTVRAIAARAGVSVGSVFTSYASKAHILDKVMEARLEALILDRSGPAQDLQGSTIDRLQSIFAIHYGAGEPHTQMILAWLSNGFDPNAYGAERPRGRGAQLQEILRHCLAKGQADGDVDMHIDLEPVVDLLIATFAWTFRLIPARGADSEGLSQAMNRHIGVIARSFAPRPLLPAAA